MRFRNDLPFAFVFAFTVEQKNRLSHCSGTARSRASRLGRFPGPRGVRGDVSGCVWNLDEWECQWSGFSPMFEELIGWSRSAEGAARLKSA